MLILLIVLILVCVGAWPSLGYHQWGYTPVSVLTVVIIVVVVLLLMGRL